MELDIIALRLERGRRKHETIQNDRLLVSLSETKDALKNLITSVAAMRPPVVNVAPGQAPVVNVTTPEVRVDLPQTAVNVTVPVPGVTIQQPKRKPMKIERDGRGQITGFSE